MDAFHRLSRFSSIVKERASSVWKSAAVQLARCRQWLMIAALGGLADVECDLIRPHPRGAEPGKARGQYMGHSPADHRCSISTESCTIWRRPCRNTSTAAFWSEGVCAARRGSSFKFRIGAPPIERITSPTRIPAASAGLPAATPITSMPRGLSRRSLDAISGVTDRHTKPTELVDVIG
jgi:hypothetical protein